MTSKTSHDALTGPLAAMALGRLAFGTVSRGAPLPSLRPFGIDDGTPELAYMTRVFGIRAIALGTGYLLSDGDARRLWQRLAFVCDISDTIAGVGHLRRADLPARSAWALTALTGVYALIGGARVLRDALD